MNEETKQTVHDHLAEDRNKMYQAVITEKINDDVRVAIHYIDKARQAMGKNLEFSLSFDEYKTLILTKRCAYSGIEFHPFKESNAKKMRAHTIDRIDNKKGYTIENTVPVCRFVNQLKSFAENDGIPITEVHLVSAAFNIGRAINGDNINIKK